MKTMWDLKDLIKLIEEHGGKVDAESIFPLFKEGENVAIELISDKDETKILISASGGEITPEKLFELIKGSDSIVVDISEDKKTLEIHIDADVMAKINRALLIPVTLSEFKLVGVDVANKKSKNKKTKNAPEQRMLGLDAETMEIKDGKLSAKKTQSDWNQTDSSKADFIKNKPSIPSAQIQSDWNQTDSSKADFIKNKPSGLKKLYEHRIKIYAYNDARDINIFTSIINDSNEQMTIDNLKQYGKRIVNGYIAYSDSAGDPKYHPILSMYTSSNQLQISAINTIFDPVDINIESGYTLSIEDNIREI